MSKKLLGFLLLCALCLTAVAPAWADVWVDISISGGDIVDPGQRPATVRLAPGGSLSVKAVFNGTYGSWTIDADSWGYDRCDITNDATNADASGYFDVQLTDEHKEGGAFNYDAPWFRVQITVHNDAPSGDYFVVARGRNLDGAGGAGGTLIIRVVNDNDQPAEITSDNQSISVVAGGSASAKFTGNKYTRGWGYEPADKPAWVTALDVHQEGSAEKAQFIATVSDDASAVGQTAAIRVYALNGVGSKSAYKTLTISGTQPSGQEPVIDESSRNQTVYGVQGGSASATLFGQHITHWDSDNHAQGVSNVELRYAENSNRCEVILTIDANAQPDDNATSNSNRYVTLNAYGKYGDKVSTNLYVSVIDGDNFKDPVIQEPKTQTLNLVQGGVGSAVFSGEHIKSWNYAQLPTGLKSIELRYLADKNACEYVVTATSTAELGSTPSVVIEAYNGAGQKTTGTLNVNIVPNDDQQTPLIDSNEALSVVPGGTAMATFTGQHTKAWLYKSLPSELKAVELFYTDDPLHCDVFIMASSTATIGETFPVSIYAYNGVGTESAPATLNVTIVADDAHETPKIDSDQNLSVVPGGFATATFTGEYTKIWKVKTLPSTLTHVALDFDTSPHRCDVTVTASGSAKIGETFPVQIYAYNAVGKETSATLYVTIVSDEDHDNPVINEKSQTLELIADGTGSIAFTGEHIKSWSHVLNSLPDWLNSVTLQNTAVENRCVIVVDVHWSAEVGNSITFPIYAYNGAGERSDPAELTVTIVETPPEPSDPPVIYNNTDEYGIDLNHVAALVGTTSTGTARFEGSDNIYDWAHGPLPSWLYSLELNYDLLTNSNVCDVKVVASSTVKDAQTTELAADVPIYSADVTIYAFNKAGEAASSDLRLVWIDDNLAPKITSNPGTVSVRQGETTTASLAGDNIDKWQVLSNPYSGLNVTISDDGYSDGVWKATVTVKAENVSPGTYNVIIGGVGGDITESGVTPVDKATLTINVTSSGGKGGSGGCDAGLGGFAALGLAALLALRKK